VDATYFASPAEWREWLAQNHNWETELVLALRKKGASKGGITYREALDEALCFGWIDGITRRIDEDYYGVRFTPRKARSVWSAVNIKRVGELIAEGRMQPPGLKAFEGRDPALANRYSFENEARTLDGEYERQFRANAEAWRYWETQPPGYRKTATFWVLSAKKEETRQRRLATLIECSANGERLPAITYTPTN
jgi:uncharacterized protein YdeI (YjbR/CyaY-like superfamily)